MKRQEQLRQPLSSQNGLHSPPFGALGREEHSLYADGISVRVTAGHIPSLGGRQGSNQVISSMSRAAVSVKIAQKKEEMVIFRRTVTILGHLRRTNGQDGLADARPGLMLRGPKNVIGNVPIWPGFRGLFGLLRSKRTHWEQLNAPQC